MIRLATFLFAMVHFGLVQAATGGASLVDPTRPPTEAVVAVGAAADATQASTFNLQSIMIKPGQKPKALINAEWIEQGQIYAGSRLLKVTATGVILQAVKMDSGAGATAAGERQVLRLNPEVEKKKPAPEKPKRAVQLK